MPPICCGLDVHQAQLTACLRRVDTDGQVTHEVREVATTYEAWLTLSTWLTKAQCPVVALERTGVSWRPVCHVLVGTVEVLVGTAQARRRRPGHKTDQADARGMRDLPRPRVAVLQARTQAKTRVVKVLEGTQIKLTRVVSELFGRRGRRMLAALVAGASAPKTLAALALGVLRRKQPPLELALTGPFTGQHAWLIRGALALIALLDRQLPDLDQHLGELMGPLGPADEAAHQYPRRRADRGAGDPGRARHGDAPLRVRGPPRFLGRGVSGE